MLHVVMHEMGKRQQYRAHGRPNLRTMCNQLAVRSVARVRPDHLPVTINRVAVGCVALSEMTSRGRTQLPSSPRELYQPHPTLLPRVLLPSVWLEANARVHSRNQSRARHPPRLLPKQVTNKRMETAALHLLKARIRAMARQGSTWQHY